MPQLYDPAKIGEYPSDIPQFPKLQGFKFAKMGERFAFVTEEEINLLVDKAVPINTKHSPSYRDGKLFANVSSNL